MTSQAIGTPDSAVAAAPVTHQDDSGAARYEKDFLRELEREKSTYGKMITCAIAGEVRAKYIMKTKNSTRLQIIQILCQSCDTIWKLDDTSGRSSSDSWKEKTAGLSNFEDIANGAQRDISNDQFEEVCDMLLITSAEYVQAILTSCEVRMRNLWERVQLSQDECRLFEQIPWARLKKKETEDLIAVERK